MPSDLDPRNQNDHHGEVLNRTVYTKGKTIIEQGDTGMRAYYIERGSVEVLIKDDTQELKICELTAGDIFGEMSLINKEPRSATIRALSAVTVTVISHDEIEQRIQAVDDKALKALIKVLVNRVQNTTKGQLEYFADLNDLGTRISNIVQRVEGGLSTETRKQFREEVEPLLDTLQSVLDRYQ